MSEAKHENPMSVRSKTALAQSLIRLMLDKAYGEISVSEIAAGAGLSRQTFYTNFDRREDILAYVLDGLFDRLAEHYAPGETPDSSFILDYFLYWNRSSDFLALLCRQGLGHLFEDRNRLFFTYDFPLGCPEPQAKYIRSSLAGLTGGLVRLWLTDGDGLCLDDLSTVAANLLDGKVFARTA